MWDKNQNSIIFTKINTMASFSLRLTGREKTKKIYLRLKIDRDIDIVKNTQYLTSAASINKSNRRKLNGNTPEIKNLNTKIEKLINHLNTQINNTPKTEIDAKWLDFEIKIFRGEKQRNINRSELLTENIKHVIETANTRLNAHKTLGISKSRINSYNNLLNVVERYQNDKQPIKVKDIDKSFARNFLNWLINDQKYSDSYSLKKIDDLKTVCKDAEIDNVEVSKQLGKVTGGKITNENIIYLSPEELSKIESLKLKSKALDNARKWLLLGCNIGQRGTDLLSLTANNIKQRNDLNVIELVQQKTKAKISIPILDNTSEILESGLPKKISIQKFNQYIKELCKLAEIDEPTKGRLYNGETNRREIGTYPKYQLVSSHICRRSYATNIYGKMPTSLIMRITGHKTEKMLLQYIGKSDLDYAQQIAEFYELQKLKSQKKSSLKVVNE